MPTYEVEAFRRGPSVDQGLQGMCHYVVGAQAAQARGKRRENPGLERVAFNVCISALRLHTRLRTSALSKLRIGCC